MLDKKLLKEMGPIRNIQRLWFRLLPVLLMVSLITASLTGTAIAESGSLLSPGSAGSPESPATVELSICGSKFNDLNENGAQESGELGLAGWTIELVDGAGTVVATTVSGPTDAAGRTGAFCFNNVRAGSYTVREVNQTGWVQTYPGGVGMYEVTVGAGIALGPLLFGNMQEQSSAAGRICGFKFEDENGNGVQDDGERGLGGWSIELTDGAGKVVATAITRDDGSFCFERLRPDDYTLSEVMQAGWEQTLPGGAGIYKVPLSAAQLESKPLLFGNMQSQEEGIICGIKFEDKNGNGKQDAGELGLGGWSIEVKDADSNWVATAVTDKDGKYCVKGLRPGEYTFAEVMQDGYQQTFPGSPFTHTARVIVGQNTQRIDFGNQKVSEPCCLTFDFLAGRVDNFSMANGAEPALPSAALLQTLPSAWSYSGFDATLMDKAVTHTFSLPAGNCVQSAKLEFKAKPLKITPASVFTDAIGISWPTPVGGSVDDTFSLHANGVPLWGGLFGSWDWFGGLLPGTWEPSNYSSGYLFSYDLGNLPGGYNLIPTLNAQRSLDFVVQDDTSVDYVRLTVEFCECDSSGPKPVEVDDNPPQDKAFTMGWPFVPRGGAPGEGNLIPSSDPNVACGDFCVETGVNIGLVVDSSEATVNGEVRRLAAPAVVRDGSTLLPFRGFGDLLGAEVEWDMAERRATYLLGDSKVEVWIGRQMARVNGKEFALSIAPVLIDGNTYVPVRSIVEALGMSVEYNPENRSIKIFQDQDLDIFDRWGK